MYSAAVDTIIESGLNIRRSFQLEFQNGYDKGGDWTVIPIKDRQFSHSVTEGTLAISTFRAPIGVSDFTYFDEFDHTNPYQLAAACRFLCTIYLNTTTPLAGLISTTDGLRRVTGAGTVFTNLNVGDLIFINTRPTELLMVYEVIDNFNLDLVEPAPYTSAGVAGSVIDAEREYIYRGIGQDKQESDYGFVSGVGEFSGCLLEKIRPVMGLSIFPESCIVFRLAGESACPAAHTFPQIYNHRILRH